MTSIKNLAVRAAFFAGIPRWLTNSPEACLTTVLFHRFIYTRESMTTARDRLKRQCEWLSARYTPITLSKSIRALHGEGLPTRPLLITIDDALIDLLEFVDIFQAFEFPITVFACAGWCAEDSAPDADTFLARTVNKLEWYNGQNKAISVDGGRLAINLDRENMGATIDDLLAKRNDWSPYLDAVLGQLGENTELENGRKCCSWDELFDLSKTGAQIGSHSVSHVRLGEASPTRIAFEIVEAQRILKKTFGSCAAFAYPYGMRGTYNQSTTAVLMQAGFDIGFLTVAGFAGAGTDPFHVPRIALPDRPLEFEEFRARVGGGAVVLAKAQELFSLVRS
jgi:peptidoglycan/xylan/chitin deacetylase (PgdA/CDA1 family)